MKTYAFCAAALGLLFIAGCRSAGLPSLAGPFRLKAREESFTKAVERDPFPRADQSRPQVALAR